MMKLFKRFAICMLLCCCVYLTSCNQAYERHSLNDYINTIADDGIAYSSFELDGAKEFLPSQTFMLDYPYLDGSFHFYDATNLGTRPNPPAITILALQYDTEIYEEAKSFMLENIPAYDDVRYLYNDYVFYENANFVKLKETRRFLFWFTMACYNDTKQELVFIGLYGAVDQKYKDDPQGNWVSFIDTYYGEYYDFSE